MLHLIFTLILFALLPTIITYCFYFAAFIIIMPLEIMGFYTWKERYKKKKWEKFLKNLHKDKSIKPYPYTQS